MSYGDPSCKHATLYFASGGYYIYCSDCSRSWVARKFAANQDTDIDTGAAGMLTTEDRRVVPITRPEALSATPSQVDLSAYDFDLERVSLSLVDAVDHLFERNEVFRVLAAHDKEYRRVNIAKANEHILKGWLKLVIKPLLVQSPPLAREPK